MSDDCSGEYPNISEDLSFLAGLDMTQSFALNGLDMSEELAPLAGLDMSEELAPLAGLDMSKQLAPLAGLDMSKQLAPLANVGQPISQEVASAVELPKITFPLSRLSHELTHAPGMFSEMNIPGQIEPSFNSVDYGPSQLGEANNATTVESERRLDIEIENFLYQFHVRFAFQRTYEALQVVGGKVDETYLLFITSGLIGGLTRFLPDKQAWGAYVIGNLLAIAYYQRANRVETNQE
ncbi:hypothetical protein [Haloarcula salinisoli]|uniref:Uncharacterized protein n=1 Tax=Haloarcula salinisoli TaxID=2487746 RepID=A0A8J8CAF6_9EURY|nr:hypothetical protein [Halomicroarcula salinisoli]MBX0305234.1 hypothetical protein [Halomicroarcula salinisoli]